MMRCTKHADRRDCDVCSLLETIDSGEYDEFLEEILEVGHRRKRELRTRRRPR